jgi:hypothetical protein
LPSQRGSPAPFAALAQQPNPEPVEREPQKVRVYVYLSPTTWGYTFKVYSDQTVIAKFRWKSDKKRYFAADLEPGRHLIYGNSDVKHGVTVTLTTGREYFVSCADDSAAHASVWIGRSTIPCMLIEPEQGQKDIAGLTLSTLKKK